MRKPVIFGKYLLLERISVGGMAEVFMAKPVSEEGLEKILAIKRILPSMAEDEEFIEMFIDEAKISGQLSHPNIGQIFELGKIDNSYFIAMEYVWGKDTLQIQNRFLRHRQVMPFPMAAFIASRVCEGLDYAHQKKDESRNPLKIIHRDVSPQNILVSYSGECKLIDFGIAKARSRSSKTQVGVLKGKFGYMSPEQVRALPLDQRTDIFSLGTILHEMVTGERLFTGESDFATLEKVRSALVTRPSKINPKVPPELERIILKALHKNPDERYTWASEMQEDLTGFLMVQQPIFTTKSLSNTISKLFKTERQREQAAMDEYKRLRIEDLDLLSDGAQSKREIAISMLPQGPPPMNSSLPSLAPHNGLKINSLDLDSDLDDDFDEDEETEIDEPSFIQELRDEMDQMEAEPGISFAELLGLDEPSGEESEEKTSIFKEGTKEALEEQPILSEPTFIFNMELGKMVQLPDQPTVIFSSKTNGGGRSDLPEPLPTVIFDASLVDSIPQAPPLEEVSVASPIAFQPRQPPMIKDILIGILLALLVILGIVVWRFFAISAPSALPTATLVVLATPARSGEVFVDDKLKGHLAPGIPLTIEKLPVGKHDVVFQPEGLEAVKMSVVLATGQVKAITIPVAIGQLMLSITPKETKVYFDGAEVSREDVKAPLELSADKEHEIRVEKNGFRTSVIKVKVNAGEKVKRSVTLEKTKPVPVRIASAPVGATVFLDGEKKGRTPLRVRKVLTGRHKVMVTLNKYVSQTKWMYAAEGKTSEVKFILKPTKTQPLTVARVDKSKPAKSPLARSRRRPSRAKPERKKPARVTPRHTRALRPRAKPIRRGKSVVKKSGPGTRAPIAASNVGYLVTNTIPWAKVIINGKDTGKMTPVAPRSKIPLKPGHHKVTFMVEGRQFNYQIKISSGKITRLIKKLPVD